MEIINQAIEIAESRCPEADWALVNVGVAPSTITITFSDPKRSPIDCRVRFLSFLGIGKDPRKCAFVGMYLFLKMNRTLEITWWQPDELKLIVSYIFKS